MASEILEAYVELNLAAQFGPKNFTPLLEIFGSCLNIKRTSIKDLQKTKQVLPLIIKKLEYIREKKLASKEIKKADKLNIKIITSEDHLYPDSLKKIFDPPLVLYVEGKLLPEDNIALSIVGTRTPTAYGQAVAEHLSKELALLGITIVSGMARGIDTCAHRGALAAGGRTIAVLGSGLDVVYPPENKNLKQKIANSGCVISEYPLGTEPFSWNFPARNRIISGLTYGTVIVEAGPKSGSLITANLATEQGREVFAVPSNISSKVSKGTNMLLKEGAKLVENVSDILEELPFKININKKAEKKHNLNSIEELIYDWLKEKALSPEEIIFATKLPASQVNSFLLTLETKDLIFRSPDNKYFIKL